MAALSNCIGCKHQFHECPSSDVLTAPSPVYHPGRTRLHCWFSSHKAGNSRQDNTEGNLSLSLPSVVLSYLCLFQQLNAINVNFFTPCLLFSKVAFSLSPGMDMFSARSDQLCHLPVIDEFQELWIIPLFFILLTGVSLGVAWLLGILFRLNRPQRYASVPSSFPSLNTPSRNFAMGASMIMNVNTLPVALLQSLAVSVPGLEWGQDDTVDSIVGRALTYLLLCGTVGQFVSSLYPQLY